MAAPAGSGPSAVGFAFSISASRARAWSIQAERLGPVVGGVGTEREGPAALLAWLPDHFGPTGGTRSAIPAHAAR